MIQPVVAYGHEYPAQRHCSGPAGRENYAVLATVNPDGSPHTSVMWVGRDGDDLLFSTLEGRVKHRNMLRDPRVSVTVIDSCGPGELRRVARPGFDDARRRPGARHLAVLEVRRPRSGRGPAGRGPGRGADGGREGNRSPARRAPLAARSGAPEHRRGGWCSRGMIEDGFAELIGAQRRGVLVTLRKDGWPQLSNVNYAWDAGTQTIRISTTDDRAKTANLRRDPRASFHVTSGDFWSYVVVEGHAELSAVARDPHDAAVEELIDLYRAVQGEHPDWDDYRTAMVRDQRLVVSIHAERAYGMVRR